jgi:glycogen synthase
MKILHVFNHSVPHTDGYVVRSANIFKFQREVGWQPLAVTSPRQEPIPKDSVEVFDGFQYFRTLPVSKTLPVLNEFVEMRRLQQRIVEVVRQEKPTIIHAHSPCSWGLSAARAARRCKLPFVYEIRGIWEDGAVDQGRLKTTSLVYRLRRQFETYVARRADALVTISTGMEREFHSRGVDKVFVVPNGVDLSKFGRLRDSSENSQKQGVTISYIGSLYAWEGVEDLVRAAALIRKSEPQVKVQIVGSGETAKSIQELIEKLSLSETVSMLGRVPHEQIAKIYDDTDILVYPRIRSRNTELVTPLKPLEAMAEQKSIVISDVGGLKELCDEGAALVFEAGNVSDLAEKCLQLMRSKDLRRLLGERALAHVQRHRNWEVLIGIYRDVYSHAKSACG